MEKNSNSFEDLALSIAVEMNLPSGVALLASKAAHVHSSKAKGV